MFCPHFLDWNLHCDPDLEYSKATFLEDIPDYEHALSD